MNEQKTPIPIMSAQKFSELTGLPVGVVNAHMDRRILPVLRLGKRRMVNLEKLREMASSSTDVLSAARPQRSEDGPQTKPQFKVRRTSDVPSNTSQTAQF